jgi:hypothetical protein
VANSSDGDKLRAPRTDSLLANGSYTFNGHWRTTESLRFGHRWYQRRVDMQRHPPPLFPTAAPSLSLSSAVGMTRTQGFLRARAWGPFLLRMRGDSADSAPRFRLVPLAIDAGFVSIERKVLTRWPPMIIAEASLRASPQ